MARSLVAVALVGAVVAFAWFAWREEPAREVASEREVAAPAEVERDARVELSRDTTPVVRPNEPARVETKDDATPITAAPADGLEVIVVDGRSGVPVAGARVRGLGLLEPMSGPNERKEVPIGLLDFEIELVGGAVYETDATGRTRIPKDGLPASYAATAPGRWGMAYFSAAEKPPHVIELSPERGARVLVVDASGRPVPNMPVAIACDEERFDDLVESLSDEQGLVDVRHWRAAQQKCLEAASTCVRPLVLASLETIPCLHVDTNPGAPDPQRLVLPPLGSVEVRVRSSDGVALFPRDVVLSRAEDKGYGDQPSREAEVFEPTTSELGRALFAHVGLDLDLRASSASIGSGFTFCVGSGPRKEGAKAVLELVVELPYTLLTGRFVGPDGAALAHVEGEVLAMKAPPRGSHARAVSRWFSTDSAGRFRVPTLDRPGAPRRETFDFTYVDDHGLTHRASVAAPALTIPETALGDVRFAALTRIASGSLAAPSGVSMQEPWVEVAAQVDSTTTHSTDGETRRSFAQVRIADDGTFEAWSQREVPVWTLRAGSSECEASLPVELAPGTAGLNVVLGAGGIVRGRVLGDSRETNRGLIVQLKRVPAVEDEARSMLAVPDVEGRFAFAVGAAGTFALVVQDLTIEPVTVGAVDGLVVGAGKDCDDPRLDPIDLRRK